MSFRCFFCGPTPPHTKMHMIVREVMLSGTGVTVRPDGRSAEAHPATQIVKEVPVCPKCYDGHKDDKPEVVAGSASPSGP